MQDDIVKLKRLWIRLQDFSEQSESVETFCAEDLPSEEQKEDVETQIQKFDRKMTTVFMELLIEERICMHMKK